MVGVQTVVTCDRCDRDSLPYDSLEEAEDELTHEGWSVGRADFADLCADCVEALDARSIRRWAHA